MRVRPFTHQFPGETMQASVRLVSRSSPLFTDEDFDIVNCVVHGTLPLRARD